MISSAQVRVTHCKSSSAYTEFMVASKGCTQSRIWVADVRIAATTCGTSASISSQAATCCAN
jgi:hypothetical protein